MNLRRDFIKIPLAAAFAGALTLTALPSFVQQVTLLNVSYDPTRELYVDSFSNESGLLAQAGWCEAGDGQATSAASG